MHQAHPRPPLGFHDQAALQSLRLLGLITLADIVLRRGARGAMGIRLAEEHPLLQRLTEFGDRYDAVLESMLLIGSVLVCATVSWCLARRSPRILLAPACLGGLAGAWLLGFRVLGGTIPEPPLALGALLLSLSTAVALLHRSPAFLAALGATLCSIWFLTNAPGSEPKLLFEQIAETVVLSGITVAAVLPALRHPLHMGLGALLAAGLFSLFHTHPTLSTHTARHLFHLGEAGLPATAFFSMLALALGSMAISPLTPRGRALSLCLLFLLTGSRGPGLEQLALRSAAALALLHSMTQTSVKSAAA